MNRSLIKLGWFEEITAFGTPTSSLKKNLAYSKWPNANKCAAYLKTGNKLCAILGISYDIFNSEIEIGPRSICTDGVYAWPSELAYYIEKYHCVVPQEFAIHAESQAFVALSLSDAMISQIWARFESEMDAEDLNRWGQEAETK